MAAGMGGDGVRVSTRAELKAALDHAMATRGRFQLIDITHPARRAVADAGALRGRGETAERAQIGGAGARPPGARS